MLITSTFDTGARLQPIIDGLAAATGETVHVAILQQAQIVHIAAAAPQVTGMRVATAIGSHDNAHATALGKASLDPGRE